jgi:hypothetical protein
LLVPLRRYLYLRLIMLDNYGHLHIVNSPFSIMESRLLLRHSAVTFLASPCSLLLPWHLDFSDAKHLPNRVGMNLSAKGVF